jgi:YVTN family beta-propeller protein
MRPIGIALLALALALAAASPPARAGRPRHEDVGRQYFLSPQASPVALSPDGTLVFVAATTSNKLDVFDAASLARVALIDVGLEPVSVAVRPDGLEVWVSNHVSDSVSVVDSDPSSPTYLKVVETIQDLDSGVSQFDEPVGIAFASNAKAYVALSSRNDVAIVDVPSYQVTGRLHVTAQEPRAIAVRNGLLFVAAFESTNRSEMSWCNATFGNNGVGSTCSLGLAELVAFVQNPNLPTAVKNIVSDVNIPDRDLFVYDTATDTLVAAVQHVGTLLYGLAVDGNGKVFITQTDARNKVNGNHGLTLEGLQNQIFLDQIATTTCSAGGCGAVTRVNLNGNPSANPPVFPTPGQELSTPYGIAVSGNNQLVVATSAGNSRLFTMTPGGAVLGRFDLGAGATLGQQIPRGVALLSDPGGVAQSAFVLNTLENTLSKVSVANPAAMTQQAKVFVGADPTPDAIRRGAVAFHTSFASTSGTFSCASCHPDGNTDQLLWRIGGECPLIGCGTGDEPRTTMPVRGLKNSLPLHWDGTLGDPVGGGNGAVGLNGAGGTDCVANDADGDHDCFLDLVRASLSGVMCDQGGSCPPGGTELTAQQQDDMATFLASVAYPPARGRSLLDGLSATALDGFRDFFTNQGGNTGNPDTCADSNAGCHALPLGASTNSSTLAGFDAPTMRGMTDRFVQFSLGPTSVRDIQVLANDGIDLAGFVAQGLEPSIAFSTAAGMQESTVFGTAFLAFESVYGVRPLNMLQMFEEASTQFPGALGRQVTLNTRTTNGAELAATDALLAALETADLRGLVNLRAVGARDGGSGFAPLTLSFRPGSLYQDNGTLSLTHAQLIAEAQTGGLVVTATAALRSGYGTVAQPLLAPGSGGCTGCGDPAIPLISSGNADPPAFNVTGTDVLASAFLLVDGQPAGGTVGCAGSGFGNCSIDLTARPADGLHVVQVRNEAGPLSNELPLCVGSAGACQ